MYDVTVFDISDESYRTALSRLKYDRKQYRRFIVDIATPGVGRFLSEAKDLDMLSDNRHYMFTSLVSNELLQLEPLGALEDKSLWHASCSHARLALS